MRERGGSSRDNNEVLSLSHAQGNRALCSSFNQRGTSKAERETNRHKHRHTYIYIYVYVYIKISLSPYTSIHIYSSRDQNKEVRHIDVRRSWR